ncbi:restriction endonuclease subunit S [Psychrobacter sp. YP14]|uniref:restriction endonuclease subunit S n=1 Tax=Psychrobacter sp. YP14 TaxID=2203895 RepID=UPI000D7D3FFE|nr:restriction endonuclease subunit S [Psychrobacter sp. YP14]AWT49119.1 restriction endonuclease subunit S [Psychrobacter sp. YP14]
MADKRYQEYTSSKLIWVKDYPAHWNLTRVKYEAYVKARVGWHGLTSNDFTDVGPYLVTGSDFKGSTIKWEDCYHCDLKRYEQDPYIQLKNGDLLLTKDGTIGKVALVDGLKDDDKATLNSGVFVVRPLSNNFTTRFYYWLLESRVFKDFVDYYASGSTIIHLYQATFVNFSYASPPIYEQERIASFLDYETAKIDTLIEKQQRLIELLTEKRQAVISHAVTKGLNPDVPMKDSGVEWLGEVPAHWEMKKLKHIGEAKNGLTYSPNDVTDADSGTLVLRSSNIQNAKLSFNDNVFVNVKIPKRMRTIKDDILICSRNGSRRLIGKNALITEEAVGQTFGAFMIVFRSDINAYLYWVLNSPLFEYQSGSFLTSTINQLTMGNLHNMEVPLPPRNEQIEIIGFLTKKMKGFDDLLIKAQEAIQLMQERRTALISAAVTGKIDVRDWVRPS